MKLFEQSESAKPFSCPACHQYLMTGVTNCRFCGAEISQEFAQSAARTEALGNRLYRRNHYFKHVRAGGALLGLGLAIMVASYMFFRAVLHTDFVWIPRGLIIGGGGDCLYGISGLVSEARSAKRESL